MAIILRVLTIIMLLTFWFLVCGLLWGQIFTLDAVCRIGAQIGIYSDEDVYDLAALISICVAGISSIVLTFTIIKFLKKKMK